MLPPLCQTYIQACYHHQLLFHNLLGKPFEQKNLQKKNKYLVYKRSALKAIIGRRAVNIELIVSMSF